MNLLFNVFYFCFYFFKWRRISFTFFYFSIHFFYFSFYFSKFRKKLEVQFFLTRISVTHGQWWGSGRWYLPNRKSGKKNRCFRVSACQKKSLRAILPRCRCCVYFVYPEGQIQTSSAGVHSVSRAENIMRIFEKSPIWKKNASSKIEIELAIVSGSNPKIYAFYPSGYTK